MIVIVVDGGLEKLMKLKGKLLDILRSHYYIEIRGRDDKVIVIDRLREKETIVDLDQIAEIRKEAMML